jgi:hypothetical protein
LSTWQLSDAGMRRRFEKLFSRLRKQDSYREDLVTSLAKLIENQIREPKLAESSSEP